MKVSVIKPIKLIGRIITLYKYARDIMQGNNKTCCGARTRDPTIYYGYSNEADMLEKASMVH